VNDISGWETKRMGEVDGKEVNGAEEAVLFFSCDVREASILLRTLEIFFFLKLQPGVDSIQGMA
jgi:hypothetical protein